MDKQGTSFYLEKLVRDGVAADMVARGQNPHLTQLQGVDLLNALIKKIQEEASELDPLGDDLLTQLADLSEAVRQTVLEKGWNPDDLERLRIQRAEERGGFAGGQYVTRLDLQAGDPWIEYYRKSPGRYPEAKPKWPQLP
jgi:predicted house-cleaning noncanonical NTP pyrophosphatase (MazG superfamily)